MPVCPHCGGVELEIRYSTDVVETFYVDTGEWKDEIDHEMDSYRECTCLMCGEKITDDDFMNAITDYCDKKKGANNG